MKEIESFRGKNDREDERGALLLRVFMCVIDVVKLLIY